MYLRYSFTTIRYFWLVVLLLLLLFSCYDCPFLLYIQTDEEKNNNSKQTLVKLKFEAIGRPIRTFRVIKKHTQKLSEK